MAFWSKITGAVVGIGIGEASAAAIEPVLEPQRQAAWSASKSRIFDLGTLAELVASGLITIEAAIAEADRNGYTEQRMRAAAQLALVAAPVAELLELWRRDKISRELVEHGLAKARIEPQYWDAILELFYARLSPEVVAEAIQRGIMADPGFLPVGPPTAAGKVPKFPVSPLDPLKEARAHGFDAERLFVETALIGNPMAPHEAAAATFRKIIDRVDFDRAIAEGRTRNEWADAIFEQSRQIPSVTDFVQGRLRGWLTEAEMLAGADRHGMKAGDVELEFKIHGRPLSWHQVWIGLQRGGTYDGPTDAIDPAFLHALRQSDIRPEWYNLAWHSRYTYPSAFVLRALTQDGDLTQAESEQILGFIGWEPTFAGKVSRRWAAGGTSSGKAETKSELAAEYAAGYISEAELRAALAQLGYSGDALELEVHLNDARRIMRWREKAVDAIEAAYANFKIDDATATRELAELNVLGDAATMLLSVWSKLRLDRVTLLTPTQVKKAYTKGLIDQATALSELEDRGYTAADAAELLAE